MISFCFWNGNQPWCFRESVEAIAKTATYLQSLISKVLKSALANIEQILCTDKTKLKKGRNLKRVFLFWQSTKIKINEKYLYSDSTLRYSIKFWPTRSLWKHILSNLNGEITFTGILQSKQKFEIVKKLILENLWKYVLCSVLFIVIEWFKR